MHELHILVADDSDKNFVYRKALPSIYFNMKAVAFFVALVERFGIIMFYVLYLAKQSAQLALTSICTEHSCHLQVMHGARS